jgi:aconitate hydratase
VLPLQYKEGEKAHSLGLTGKEKFTITGISGGLHPLQTLNVVAESQEGKKTEFQVITRIDSNIEVKYYENGGILHYVLRDFLNK